MLLATPVDTFGIHAFDMSTYPCLFVEKARAERERIRGNPAQSAKGMRDYIVGGGPMVRGGVGVLSVQSKKAMGFTNAHVEVSSIGDV